MLGWPVDDVVGLKAFDLVHPDEFETAAATLVEGMTTSKLFDPLTVRLAHADGRWVPIEVAGARWHTDDGPVGVVLTLRDAAWRVEAEAALRASEARFRALVQNSYDAVLVLGADGTLTYASPAIEHLFGRPVAELLGTTGFDFIHPDDAAAAAEALEAAFERPGERVSVEARIRAADDTWRWVDVVAVNRLDDPVVNGVVTNVRDITERIEAQRDSRRLTDIFEATSDLVAMTDRVGRLLYLNTAGRRHFGLPGQGGLEEIDTRHFTTADTMRLVESEIGPALERDGMWSGEFPLARPDGTVVPHLAQMLAHLDSAGELEFVSAVLHDISERKAFESRLAHQATHDPLTGLPNRTLLLDRLDMALARSRRHHRLLAVLFLDLDHFKVVNDSLGHSLGDRLLVAIAERLATALRPGDTVARFGGDEFVVLCEDLADPQDAVAIAERVNDAVSGAFTVDKAEVFVGMSIGIAMAEGSGADAESLIRDADAAMYRAKERGRARWVMFDNDMRASAVDRLDIENALRRALDRHELRVFYQPTICLASGRILGVEALLRWEHPERGLLLPGDFIAVAEETGLIVPIGAWVLDQACRQVQRWHASNPAMPPLVVAVNLSGRQLEHPRLADDVGRVLADTGIAPERVELEITESVLMDDVEMSRETLDRLKALGVRLVVDDFGTGYSSLSYLRRFPVDQLKVDRSFVDGLGTDPGDSAIVTAIVTLAHTLGLEAVAEGVETDGQLAELRRLECDKAQGFFMARPQPGHETGELLTTDPHW